MGLTISLVLPGTGTGALSSRKTHVSISRISQATSDEICSVERVPDEPVRIPQTVSRLLASLLATGVSLDGVPGLDEASARA